MLMDGADAAPKFELGDIALVAGAATLPLAEVERALARHRRCEWGEVGPKVAESNAEALRKGGFLVSLHRSAHGTQFVVSTAGNRAITLVMLRSEI